MQGRTHCLSGIAAGGALAPVAGCDDAAEVVLFALGTGGFAIAPDIDHPSSLVSSSLGPVTGMVSRGLRALSGRVYQVTKGPRDEDWTGTHRHLTHTAVFAALIGAIAAVSALLTPWAVVAVVAAGIGFTHLAVGRGTGKLAKILPRGARRLARGWPLFVGAAAAAWWVASHGADPDVLATELTALSWRVGTVVTVGMIIHSVGDGLTEMGVPLLWPLPIAGETWYELRPPSFLRFKTGKVVESWLITPALLACLVWVMWSQGLDDVVRGMLDQYEQVRAE